MAAAFGNLAVLENVNAVCIDDGRKPVGYDDRRAILGGFLEGSENFLMKTVIDSDTFVPFNGRPIYDEQEN